RGVLAAGQTPRIGDPAPDVAGERWINGGPLTTEGLRGRVVLVEFWTYGWINCRNVIPQLRAWHQRFEALGLTVVGVHSPEFFWEKPYEKVADAMRRLGV